MSFTQDYSGSALNGAAKEEGATAGDNEDENCCICLDTFKNKKQLKCKHEFCEDCLSKSVETMGPICPLCKYVFGRIQGFQPDGKMTWKTKRTSLPGFPGCGTIVINYDMQGGRQAARHPNPRPDNEVIWHNIHHKTSKSGGPQCFGYPDPDYLSRVREELKVNGIE
ncbi:E3 ubiquitin-protein ligase DTX3L-like isoform X2 [Scomber japonicus]|uniref:E3 ubiquitin-protein ligase DTX3L-like isoform X2 n=1 Tax=Scomber japonicus TaxID=13676 RepID=UPI002304D4A2|nr:E3 ubiquitin-protein ligase DTX3L-like isoform X2 [Scomber japonicus]